MEAEDVIGNDKVVDVCVSIWVGSVGIHMHSFVRVRVMLGNSD